MKHEFALYTLEVSRLKIVSGEYDLTEKTLVHRIAHILRLVENDTVLLFDETDHVTCTIVAITKKLVRVSFINVSKNQMVKPLIHWFLPVLEREAFEDALYSLAAMGATSVTPVITQKSRKKWGTQKDYDRIKRIMIAAAEQSKNFALPVLHELQKIADAVTASVGTRVLFDVTGQPAFEIISKLHTAKPQAVTCCVGPEGDLTEEEKDFVRAHKFLLCQLTPTVLRACHAVTVGMGLMRSSLI